MRLLGSIIGYILVLIAALSTAFVVIRLADFDTDFECSACTDDVVRARTHLPRLRAACDKQFLSEAVRKDALDAGTEVEFLAAFVEGVQSAAPDGKSPVVPRTASSVGYVLVRVHPAYGYDYSGGVYDTGPTPENTRWKEVNLTVVRYISPASQQVVCEGPANFRDGSFEGYCEFPLGFAEEDGGQQGYRYYLTNTSSVNLEYCIVSNCDASAPFGQGALCEVEQPNLASLKPGARRGFVRPISKRVLQSPP